MLESIGLLITVVAIVAWIAFLIDFLPTRYGYAELSRTGRYCAIALAVAAGGWVLYRWLYSRLQVVLKNDSLALLIERRYPEFQDGLVTAVSLPIGNQDLGFGDRELRKSTIADVEKRLPAVRLSHVISAKPANASPGIGRYRDRVICPGRIIGPRYLPAGSQPTVADDGLAVAATMRTRTGRHRSHF